MNNNNTKSRQNPVPVYAGNRVVGKVTDSTFTKTITGSKHLLRKPPAVAFDLDSLYQAQKHGAITVDVLDRDDGKHWIAPIAAILKHGFTVDRGHGVQIALTLNSKHWQCNKPAAKVNKELQLALW